MQFGNLVTARTQAATVENGSTGSSACGTYPYCPENFRACLCDFDMDGNSPIAETGAVWVTKQDTLSIFHQRSRRLLRLLALSRPPVGTQPSMISDLSIREETEANTA
jgi:hypothetical protein